MLIFLIIKDRLFISIDFFFFLKLIFVFFILFGVVFIAYILIFVK